LVNEFLVRACLANGFFCARGKWFARRQANRAGCLLVRAANPVCLAAGEPALAFRRSLIVGLVTLEVPSRAVREVTAGTEKLICWW
jgi:hypothetical protein